jgi:hypothetical protein
VRCRFRLELSGALAGAESFSIVDAQGKTIHAMVFQGQSMQSQSPVPLVAGRSAIVTVDDTARTLVFWHHLQEIGRLPLTLVPGEVTVIRP